MKKILKSRIFYFVLGLIVATTVGVSATILYQANEIGFTPQNPNWKVNNLESALNDLYENKNQCSSNNVWNFGYKADEDEFVVPKTGTYKLEVWGAQTAPASTYVGGYGGYSVGEVNLTKGEKLYINVGGSGTSTAEINVSIEGGYNCGGDSHGSYDSRASWRSSGAGATHIAKVSGLICELEEYKGTLSEDGKYYKSNDILIVAGGGGGIATWNNSEIGLGGAGGGYKGGTGTGAATYSVAGTGGTQTAGGTGSSAGVATFGKGASAKQTGTNNVGGAGGGGGFFGGGAGNNNAGGGGGSGYIGSPLLSNKKMVTYTTNSSNVSNEENIKTETTECMSDDAVKNCVKIGNGAARITYLS